MERLESLGIDDYKIYQDDQKYCFTSDSILLSRFATVKKGDKVADFCAGSGIVGIHLYALNSKLIESVTLFEMQEPLSNLATKSIRINNLQDKITVINTRVQDIDKAFNGRFSLIVCNPPYMKVSNGQTPTNDEIALCKSEISLTLEELVKSIAKALKFGGRVDIVHRSDRLIEVIEQLKKNGIEPKKLQFVRAKTGEPYLFLIEGVKGAKSGLKVFNEIEN